MHVNEPTKGTYPHVVALFFLVRSRQSDLPVEVACDNKLLQTRSDLKGAPRVRQNADVRSCIPRAKL